MFESFRIGLREALATDGDFGITLFDEALVSQVELCTRKDVRIDVRKGHDDILFGALIANLSMRQWAPPRVPNRVYTKDDEIEAEALSKMRIRGEQVVNEARGMLARHHAKISRSIESGGRKEENVMEEY